jgi:dihydrofolate synthase/folylpolyglutamate synthase
VAARPSRNADAPPIEAALAWLRTFTDFEQTLAPDVRRTFDLGRPRRLLAAIGDPHLGRPQIHVTGTKGKGSVALFADAILRAHGVATFRFTSPHVERLNERVAIAGADVTDAALAAAIESLRPEVLAMASDPPTFFEIVTAAGFRIAHDRAVDADVVEVGLGGRLDATNVIAPTVSVITSIGLDHTRILGRTRDKIAAEKAGIIKPRTPVLTGLGPGDPGFDVILARARELEAPIVHRDGGLDAGDVAFARGDDGRPGVRFDGAIDGLRIRGGFAPGGGRPQATNAILAIGAAARTLAALHRALDLPAALGGLAAATLPARAELFGSRTQVLIDGAHTGPSCAALAELAAWCFAGRRVVLLGGMTADRSARALFSPFRRLVSHAVFAPIRSPRTADPETCAREWRKLGGEGSAAGDAEAALERALRAAGDGGAVVAAGSFYLAGELRPLARRLA